MIQYRQAQASDVCAMARIRAAEWGSQEQWEWTISAYLEGRHHPQKALDPRIVYVALDADSDPDSVSGFIAGHLTRRYECDGELQWINVIPEHRGKEVASELLLLLARWFADRNALRVCVDVAPENAAARRFYQRHGATELNAHWLVWTDIRAVLVKP